jgi:hypothetical protein
MDYVFFLPVPFLKLFKAFESVSFSFLFVASLAAINDSSAAFGHFCLIVPAQAKPFL